MLWLVSIAIGNGIVLVDGPVGAKKHGLELLTAYRPV